MSNKVNKPPRSIFLPSLLFLLLQMRDVQASQCWVTHHMVFFVTMYARAYLSSTSDEPTKAGFILSSFFGFKVSKTCWQSICGSLPTFWWSGNAFIARLLWCWCLQDVNMTRWLILAVIDGKYSYKMHMQHLEVVVYLISVITARSKLKHTRWQKCVASTVLLH